MASNPHVNKVIFGGRTLIDLSGDTVAANNMLSGTTAHDKSGAAVTGNIPTQAAQTITPGTTDQTIASGKYLTGAQTIKGDANLVAENIAEGVSIFGIQGSHSGGGGGDVDMFIKTRTASGTFSSTASIIGKFAFAGFSCPSVDFPNCTSIEASAFLSARITNCSFPECVRMGTSAFYGNSSITTASFPKITSLGSYAFRYCQNLTTISFPILSDTGDQTFQYCSKLTNVYLPVLERIGNNAFVSCTALTAINLSGESNLLRTILGSAFAGCTSLSVARFKFTSNANYGNIDSNAFHNCKRLMSLYIYCDHLISLTNINAFQNTPISTYTTETGARGKVYVPTSLINTFKTATNWAIYSDVIVGM